MCGSKSLEINHLGIAYDIKTFAQLKYSLPLTMRGESFGDFIHSLFIHNLLTFNT